MVVAKGKVLDCKDLEGDNCRMTIWVEIEDTDIISKFVGREFAMVYGDYAKKSKRVEKKNRLNSPITTNFRQINSISQMGP